MSLNNTSGTPAASLARPLLAKPHTLADAHALFQAHHLARVAPKTADWYNQRLSRFVAYLGADTPLTAVEAFHIEVWFSSLYDEQELHKNNPYRHNEKTTYSLRTIHGHGRAVKKFFAWLRKMRILPHSPAQDLALPRLTNKPLPGIAPHHFRALLDALAQEQTPDLNNYRDRAILLFLGTTGARSEGAATLSRENLNMRDRIATVTEKGSKSRAVFFTAEAAQAIQTYHQLAPLHTAAFLTQWRGQTRAMTSEAIRQMVARRCKQFSLPHYSPHDFRRMFASVAVEKGCDLSWLQTVLGHEDVSTTQIYVTHNTAVLKAKYDRLFP